MRMVLHENGELLVDPQVRVVRGGMPADIQAAGTLRWPRGAPLPARGLLDAATFQIRRFGQRAPRPASRAGACRPRKCNVASPLAGCLGFLQSQAALGGCIFANTTENEAHTIRVPIDLKTK